MNRSELTHQWAAQSRPRRKAGNISYDGPTLYSYSTAIAHIHVKRNARGRATMENPGISAGIRDPNDAGAFVLMRQRGYSNTTRAHKSFARSAVSHLPLAEVPHIRPLSAREHGENLEAILANAADHLTKAQRAQMPYNAEWRFNVARSLHDTASAYARFFKVRRKIPAFPGTAWMEAMQRAERIANPDPASADKRERARAARKAAAAIRERKALELAAVHDAARRSDWRLHGAFDAVRLSAMLQPVMLRLDGEEIVTSMGARIPAAAAPKVWEWVQYVKSRACPMQAHHLGAASRMRIGDYPLDRIDADGTLHAGCHRIPYSELAMMARALGLAS